MSEIRNALARRVKLAVSVIGVGHAGGQIVQRLPEDYGRFIVNSSEKDLDQRVLDQKIPAFIIGNEGRGAGKSRALAKQLLKMNGKTLFQNEKFDAMLKTTDICFVVGAMAGGTGSGIAPDMLTLLKKLYPSVIFIYYGIVPRRNDSFQAITNTLECFNEITMQDVPYMLVDLERYAKLDSDMAYANIAEHMCHSIEFCSGQNLNYSESGMIDENDLRVILSARGYMAIYSTGNLSQEKLDDHGIQKVLIDEIKHSCAIDRARDGAIQNMGVVINTTDSAKDSIRSGDYSEIINFLGRPYAIFENYALISGTTSNATIILSGMSDPEPKMMELYEIIKNIPIPRRMSSAFAEIGTQALTEEMQSILYGKKNTEADVKSTLDDFFG